MLLHWRIPSEVVYERYEPPEGGFTRHEVICCQRMTHMVQVLAAMIHHRFVAMTNKAMGWMGGLLLSAVSRLWPGRKSDFFVLRGCGYSSVLLSTNFHRSFGSPLAMPRLRGRVGGLLGFFHPWPFAMQKV